MLPKHSISPRVPHFSRGKSTQLATLSSQPKQKQSKHVGNAITVERNLPVQSSPLGDYVIIGTRKGIHWLRPHHQVYWEGRVVRSHRSAGFWPSVLCEGTYQSWYGKSQYSVHFHGDTRGGGLHWPLQGKRDVNRNWSHA